MTQTWFRVQSADRDATVLLNPAEQVSRDWASQRNDRAGVSVCDSMESLAAYLVGSGLPFGAGEWVVIELTGSQSDDQPLEAASGEYLIYPETIESIRSMDDAGMWDLLDAAYTNLDS